METVSYVLEVRETKQHGSEDPPLLMLLTFALGLAADLGPAGEDGGREAAAGSEFAADNAPFGLHGVDDAGQQCFQKGKESVIEMGTGGMRRLVSGAAVTLL